MLIFEKLHCIAPASLWHVRLASTQFSQLVDPLVYRHLKLTRAFVRCFSNEPVHALQLIDPVVYRHLEPTRACVKCFHDETLHSLQLLHATTTRRVRNAICAFTRHITIDKELDWSVFGNILLSLHQFDHLNWCFWLGSACFPTNARAYRVPQKIIHCLNERWPNAQLSVESHSSVFDYIDDLSGLPRAKVFSLKLQTILPLGSSLVDGTLKTFLLQCDQLKDFIS